MLGKMEMIFAWSVPKDCELPDRSVLCQKFEVFYYNDFIVNIAASVQAAYGCCSNFFTR